MALTQVDQARGEVTHRWPQILPGGKAVLFTSHTSSMGGFDEATIQVMTLADRRTRTIQRGGTFGRYLASGHLVYLSKDALLAVPFDPDRLELRGSPVPVLEDVSYSTRNGAGQIDYARNGTLVYYGRAAGSELKTLQCDVRRRRRGFYLLAGSCLASALIINKWLWYNLISRNLDRSGWS